MNTFNFSRLKPYALLCSILPGAALSGLVQSCMPLPCSTLPGAVRSGPVRPCATLSGSALLYPLLRCPVRPHPAPPGAALLYSAWRFPAWPCPALSCPSLSNPVGPCPTRRDLPDTVRHCLALFCFTLPGLCGLVWRCPDLPYLALPCPALFGTAWHCPVCINDFNCHFL